MIGVVELTDRKGRRLKPEHRSLLGLRCLWLEVPAPAGLGEKRQARRVRRGGGLLREAGVRRVLAAAEFSNWEALYQAGLRPVEPEAFCQAVAAPLALAALTWQERRLEQAAVLLSGRRAEPALVRAAELLCPRVRDLAVDAGADGAALAAWLRGEFGAAVRPPETVDADVALCFGPEGAPGRTVFRLWGSEPVLAGFLPALAGGGLPAGLDRLPLLAALWEAGLLPLETLRFLPPNTKECT